MNTHTINRGWWGGLILLVGAMVGPAWALAQARPAEAGADATYDTQKYLSVAVTHFPEARTVLTGFIRRRAVRVQKQEKTSEHVLAEFALRTPDLGRLDSLVRGLVQLCILTPALRGANQGRPPDQFANNFWIDRSNILAGRFGCRAS